MKIAFSSPTANEDERRTLFDRFREVGYDGLQLKKKQYYPYLNEPDRFKLEWGGLPGVASGLITGGNLDDENRAFLKQVFSFAGAVGTDLVVHCISRAREGVTKEDIRNYAAVLSDLGKEAQDRGVKLSLHQHFNQPVMYREDVEVFFDAADDGTVGLTVDTAHLVKSGISDVAGVIQDFRGVIDNYHLKDFSGGAFKVLGQGDIDFAPIFTAIKETRYSGWLSADEESGGDIVEGMEGCFTFINAQLHGSKASDA